jgi:hypothetical protein
MPYIVVSDEPEHLWRWMQADGNKVLGIASLLICLAEN